MLCRHVLSTSNRSARFDFTPACFVSPPQAIAKKLVKAGIEPQTLCSILSQASFSQNDDDVEWLGAPAFQGTLGQHHLKGQLKPASIRVGIVQTDLGSCIIPLHGSNSSTGIWTHVKSVMEFEIR